jgi:hypothetical protein
MKIKTSSQERTVSPNESNVSGQNKRNSLITKLVPGAAGILGAAAVTAAALIYSDKPASTDVIQNKLFSGNTVSRLAPDSKQPCLRQQIQEFILSAPDADSLGTMLGGIDPADVSASKPLAFEGLSAYTMPTLESRGGGTLAIRYAAPTARPGEEIKALSWRVERIAPLSPEGLDKLNTRHLSLHHPLSPGNAVELDACVVARPTGEFAPPIGTTLDQPSTLLTPANTVAAAQ